MSNLIRRLKHYWNVALHYVEKGDLVVFLIAISVFHFGGVLAPFDNPLVAYAFGIGIDVGMYRLVKAALKYHGWWWGGALVLLALSYFYHLAYYVQAQAEYALALAAPIPILIGLLAALSNKERLGQKLEIKLAREDAKQEKVNSEKITPSHSQSKRENENEDAKPRRAKRGNGKYAKFRIDQMARNGDGPMGVGTVMEHYRISQATAYRWLNRYDEEMSGPTKETVN